MVDTAFRLQLPQRQRSGVVFASPHSGDCYFDDFLANSVLNDQQIRSSADAYVDRLFAVAPKLGAPLLSAVAPRAYVDLNRASDELDSALIQGVPKKGQNPRVASGLGVIPRVVANGRAIYSGKISRHEADERLEKYWTPYHNQLELLMQSTRSEFGMALLVDCHSMPHEAIGEPVMRNQRKAEIVLGDRFGASASSEVMDEVEAAFTRAGLSVARNAPFAGAYITQRYGRPSDGQHAIQVEIDRSLYMDEQKLELHRGFVDLRDALAGVVADLVSLGEEKLPFAAE